MERRDFLTLLGTGSALSVLAACGADEATAPSQSSLPVRSTDATLPPVTEQPTTLAPATTEPPAGEPEAPGAADVSADALAILTYGSFGGFTTREFAFQSPPEVILTDDGHVILLAETPAVAPGPFMPAHVVRTITPEGVERILGAARDAGLLADAEYEGDPQLADAPTAVLEITFDGTTYTQQAYGLFIGGPAGGDLDGAGDELDTSKGPAALAAFVTSLRDLSTLVGDDALGAIEEYVPAAYQIIVAPAGDLTGYDQDPTIVDWPADSGVTLANVVQCIEVDAAGVGETFRAADRLTFFAEAGEIYNVIARPAYPGRTCET